jgi:serine-type D-Ala-D-Ala carboxypeptidase (penicillin-binding protein 5/6)
MVYRFAKVICTVLLTISALTCFAAPAVTANNPPAFNPQPPPINAKAYVLMDANSGAVLAQSNMNQRLEPASLTKLMTAYLASTALKQNQMKLGDMVTISEKAWRTGGSRMFIQVGNQVSVKDLLNGIIVASGNDSSVALAEHIAGTEDAFAQMMNETASRLGMQNTHFMDATGLPDPNHYSSAYDLALLTRAIIHDYPEDYSRYKQQWVIFNNIRQPNRNQLLWRDPSVDGLKTGHTEHAGYCLVSSALRNNTRLITVVLGEPSDYGRTVDTQALLNWGYRFYETHQLFEAHQTIDQKQQPRVWFGQDKYAKLGFNKAAYVTIPANQYKQLKMTMTLDPKLNAPLVKGQTYGAVSVTLNGQPLTTIPIVALEDNPKGNIISRGWDHIAILFSKWFKGV